MKQFVFIFSAIFILAGGVVFADQVKSPPEAGAVQPGDQGGLGKTAEDQSVEKEDVEISRKIRREITKDDSLSISARNVKIITERGKVTLRGPVKSEDEKEKVFQVAQQIAGKDKVENQLEVKSN